MAGDVVSLREYFDQRLRALEDISRERWVGQHREQAQRDEAIKTALAAVMERFAQANEWRQTYSDRDKTFATNVGLDAVEAKINIGLGGVDAKVRALENLNERTSGIATERQRQAERRQWLIGLGFSVITVLFSWLVNR